MKLYNLKNYLKLGLWGTKASFGSLGTKHSSSHKSKTLALIFKKRTSFYPEL